MEVEGVVIGMVVVVADMMMKGEEEDHVPVQDPVTERDVVTGEAIQGHGQGQLSVQQQDVAAQGHSQETNAEDTSQGQMIDTGQRGHIQGVDQMKGKLRHVGIIADQDHQK